MPTKDRSTDAGQQQRETSVSKLSMHNMSPICNLAYDDSIVHLYPMIVVVLLLNDCVRMLETLLLLRFSS